MKKNNSDGKPYYSQRNNELRPEGACNVTAMINALSAAGWPVERLADEKYRQPEDALMHFLLADANIDREWHRIDPPGSYPPNEWHPLLCLGTNMLLRNKGLLGRTDTAVTFSETHLVTDFAEAVDAGGAAVVSGCFETANRRVIGHVVAVVGYKADDTNGTVKSFLLDDPWGDYRTKYEDAHGNDIEMPLSDFTAVIKAKGSEIKLGHIVRKYTEAAA